MLALFTLGISSRKCNANGAIFGFILSLLIGILVGFGPIITNQNPTPLPRSIEGCANTNPLISYTTSLTTLRPSTAGPLDSESNNASALMYIFKISYMWICPLTWLITTIAALVYSHLLPDENLIVDEGLLMPILRRNKDPATNEIKMSSVCIN